MTQLMLRKNFIWIVLLLMLTTALAACQSSNDSPSDPAPTTASVAATAPSPETNTETTTEIISETTTAAESEQAPATEVATQTFRLSEGTEARFYIDEVLMGQDKNVVGVTALVEGEISLDPTNPGGTQISPIRIDARDLTTDGDRRNGAIQRFILQSDQEQYQYITFEPTSITGLPATVTVGEPFEFTVTGNLTIRDITHEETFQLSVTPVSESEIAGLGSTTVLRANYELTIPSVPSVANVSEEVKLEIAFTATAS